MCPIGLKSALAVPVNNDVTSLVPIRYCPNPLGSLPLKNRFRNLGAKRPQRPLWGVAERSESFKIMIAGGNHSMIKSWQPERAV